MTALFFKCPASRSPATLKYIFYGRFAGAGFTFRFHDRMESYNTWQGGVFAVKKVSLSSLPGADAESSEYHFLRLNVTPDEARKIHSSCAACAACKKPFNLQDLLLIHTHHILQLEPPPEIPLFAAATLNNAQAIILILKECLDPATSPLVRPASNSGFLNLHSRRTFVESIYNTVLPYAQVITWEMVVNALNQGNQG